MRSKLKTLLVAVGGALALAGAASAQETEFTITPYVWAPNVNGNFRFEIPPGATGAPDVEVGPNDYLENLDVALMVAGEARFQRLSVFTDVIYLDFSNENSAVRQVTGPGGRIQFPVDSGSQFNFKGWLWTLGAGWDVIQDEHVRLQLFGGFRYLNLETELNWRLQGPLGILPQAGQISRDGDAWDGLVGARGEVRAGDWFFPYYADVGAGSSDLTWQAMAGVGYRWGWGDVRLLYRHLEYEQGESDLVQDLQLSGPALGLTFRF